MGRRKKFSFKYIKEQVCCKLKGWEEKMLSQAGREILIKLAIQAIPTYTMGCFKLHPGLCTDIECLIQKFCCG